MRCGAKDQRGLKRSFAVWLGVLGAVAILTSTAAQASSGSPGGASARSAYHAGKYFGTITQTAPKSYGGKIHFLVRNGKITHLSFTVSTKCGSALSSVVRERVDGLVVKVKRDGSFLYRGVFKQRHIRFKGRLSGHTARGKLFETFPTGTLVCSMGEPASFAAAH